MILNTSVFTSFSVAHQSQRFAGCLLFGFFLTATDTAADDVGIEMDLHGKFLVVVRSAFTDVYVFHALTGILLHDLLQLRFVILEMCLPAGGQLLLQKWKSKPTGGFQPTV